MKDIRLLPMDNVVALVTCCLVYIRLLSLRRLLAGERRSSVGADVGLEPKVAGHVVTGLGQQGQQLLFGLSEFLERHAQTGLDTHRVRIVVVLVVHHGLGQFAFDVLVL